MSNPYEHYLGEIKIFKPWLLYDGFQGAYLCLACPMFDDPELVQSYDMKRKRATRHGAAKFLSIHNDCGYLMHKEGD